MRSWEDGIPRRGGGGRGHHHANAAISSGSVCKVPSLGIDLTQDQRKGRSRPSLSRPGGQGPSKGGGILWGSQSLIGGRPVLPLSAPSWGGPFPQRLLWQIDRAGSTKSIWSLGCSPKSLYGICLPPQGCVFLGAGHCPSQQWCS